MESSSPEIRHRLILGKYRVVKVERDALSVRIVIDLGNAVTMTCSNLVPYTDVRVGDILTFYTEILAHAPLVSTSEQ